MYQNLSLGRTSGGVAGPAERGSLIQRLTLVADIDNQEWTSVVDALSITTAPTITAGGDVQQSDAGYFAAGTESVWSNAAGDTIEDATLENLLVHYYNTNGSNGLWMKRINSTLWYADQYALDTVFTLGSYQRNLAFYGAGDGALRDISGDVVLDGGGFVVFTNHEESLTADSVIPPEIVIDPTQMFA